MLAFHGNWAYVVVIVNLVAGLLGLLWVRRQPTAPRPFWYLIGAGQVALLVQVSMGMALTQSHGNPDGIHMFYGFVVLIAAILSFALRSEDAKRNVIVFSSVALFIGAVSVRGMITA